MEIAWPKVYQPNLPLLRRFEAEITPKMLLFFVEQFVTDHFRLCTMFKLRIPSTRKIRKKTQVSGYVNLIKTKRKKYIKTSR